MSCLWKTGKALYIIYCIAAFFWHTFILVLILFDVSSLISSCISYEVYGLGLMTIQATMLLSIVVVNIGMIRNNSVDPFSVLMCFVYAAWCSFGVFSYYTNLFACAASNGFYPWMKWSFVVLGTNLGGTVFMLKALRMHYHRQHKKQEQIRRHVEEQRARNWNIGRERSRFIVPRTFSWNRATTERPTRPNDGSPYYQMDDLEHLVNVQDTIRNDNMYSASK